VSAVAELARLGTATVYEAAGREGLVDLDLHRIVPGSLAAGAGVTSAFESITPPALFLFEPHQPELCNFMPTTFVDITPVIEAKREAMAAMEAQKYLQTYYAQRAEQRAHHARRASGNADVRYAEAFQRVLPQVVAEL